MTLVKRLGSRGLFYVFKGSADFAGFKSAEGGLCVLPSRDPVSVRIGPDTDAVLIEFPPETANPGREKGRDLPVSVHGDRPSVLVIPGNRRQGVEYLLREIVRESETRLTGFDIFIRHRFDELFLVLRREGLDFLPAETGVTGTGIAGTGVTGAGITGASIAGAGIAGASQERRGVMALRFNGVVESADYIRGHYAEEFDLNDLASGCGLNATYFCKAFKDHTGMTVFEFINNIRIQKACLLLKSTEMPVIDVAYGVGYNNISFFNRYFKKVTGESPRDFRVRSRR